MTRRRKQRPIPRGSSRAKHGTPMCLHVSRRQLATILAALRFHQDENLQTAGTIPDKIVKRIATHNGLFKALRFDEVRRLCRRLRRQIRNTPTHDDAERRTDPWPGDL